MMMMIIIIIYAHQHKAVGMKTKWLQWLLIRCSLCWGRRLHSPAAGLWRDAKVFFITEITQLTTRTTTEQLAVNMYGIHC